MSAVHVQPRVVVECVDVAGTGRIGEEHVVTTDDGGCMAAPQSAKEFVTSMPRCAYTCARATCEFDGNTARLILNQGQIVRYCVAGIE
jgi:hypothetical protein